ncbi:TPA: acid stress response protein YqgB [Pluralibacter gergoviae]|nr:acid stress response protein YqgB [Pluralibacter gergoviae]
MNMKPVAPAAFQHSLLDCGAVYGLLSHGNIAIVISSAIEVCCFTLSTVSEVRYV